MGRRLKIPKDDAKAWRAEAQKQRKYLTELTTAVKDALLHLDVLMKMDSSVQRGRAIAKVINSLEFANDSARHFALDIDLRDLHKKRPE